MISSKINMMQMRDAGSIKRGKVTGYRDFFILSQSTINEYNIPAKYLCPVIPSGVHSCLLTSDCVTEYLLNVNESKDELLKNDDGKKVLKYIESAERTKIIIKRGSLRTNTKISELPTMKARRLWYSLKLGISPPMFLSRLIKPTSKNI